MKVRIEAQTDVGRVRELNEDSFRLLPRRNAVIVCDGMGGHAAGEVASSTAAETIADMLEEPAPSLVEALSGALDSKIPAAGVSLASAVRVANRRLFNAASRSNKLRGMGTTVVAAVFVDGVLITAHVGDSRAYRIADGRIEQLTIDHSWIAELVQTGQVKAEDAESFADKNVITRALGTRGNVQVDLGMFPARPGELYLLCSDGVCGYVPDEDILATITQQGDDLKKVAQALIDTANAAGGLDNSTVALVRVEPGDTAEQAVDSQMQTLPEESSGELELIDRVIQERYPDDDHSSPAPGPAADPNRAATLEDEDAAPKPAEPEPTSGLGQGFHWGWWLFLFLALIVLATFLWPSLSSDSSREDPIPARVDSDSQSGTGAPSADVGERPPTDRRGGVPGTGVHEEGLIYLVAFGEFRQQHVYWDGVYQGQVSELERGLLVDTGRHNLVIMSEAGETTLARSLTVAPADTLDIEVR